MPRPTCINLTFELIGISAFCGHHCSISPVGERAFPRDCVQSVLTTVMDRLPVELSVERQTTPGTPLIGKVPASTQGSGNPAYHAETSNGCNGSIRCERAKLPSRNL